MCMSVVCSHLIRYEEVVAPGYFLHDVSLDQVILQHGHAIVDQDGGLGRLQHNGHVSRVTCHEHDSKTCWVGGVGGINSLHSWWSQGLLMDMSTTTLHSLFEHSDTATTTSTSKLLLKSAGGLFMSTVVIFKEMVLSSASKYRSMKYSCE